MQSISGEEIYSLIETICSFGSRYMGTNGLAQARDYILSRLEEIGLQVKTESFSYLSYETKSVSLHVDGRRLDCEPLANAAFAKKPVTAPLAYCGVGTQEEIARLKTQGIDLTESILVSDNMRSFLAYTAAEATGALGLISVTTLQDNTIRCGSGRLDRKPGSIPSVCIGGEDGRKIIPRLRSGEHVEATLQTDGRMEWKEGQNLIGRPPNLAGPRILLSAHYDSLWNGIHAMDNAAGVATIMEVARELTRSKETGFECVLFSGEELGLWGSAGYVERHQQDLSDINAVINLDTVGSDQSKVEVGVTADIRPFCQTITEQMGVVVDCWNTPPRPGSDQRLFAERGVPSIWIANCGSDLRYHTPLDVPSIMRPERLEVTARLTFEFFKQLRTRSIQEKPRKS